MLTRLHLGKATVPCSRPVLPLYTDILNSEYDTQPNESCCAGETLICLKQQVNLACEGKISAVKELQTNTGVKCAYTQVFIDSLLGQHKDMVKDGFTREQATDHLQEQVVENEEHLYNPLLNIPGKTYDNYL
jgi:hypothetical protein